MKEKIGFFVVRKRIMTVLLTILSNQDNYLVRNELFVDIDVLKFMSFQNELLNLKNKFYETK